MTETTRRYGGLVALPVPGPPVLLVSEPDAVGQVLRTGARHWTKQTVQYATLAAVTGPGLLANPGPEWIERRRVVAPAFHHRRLAGVVETVRAATARTVAGWRDLPDGGAAVDVDALAMRTTLDVVGRTLFAHDLGPVAPDLVAATDAVSELIVARARAVVPLPQWVPTPVNRRMSASVSELDRICREVVATRRRRGVRKEDDDLLGLLIAAGLGDDDVRDELVTMVIAGHETVAAALTWTLLLLAEHPEAQSRLRQEVREATVGDTTTLRGALPWTSAVVDEALRINPPAWVISRRATLPDSLAGQPVPAGTLVIISPWLVHRRPDSWSEPERFLPERFLGQGTTARADYIPFGLGPRLCIGRELALLELSLLLGELLRDHQVGLPPGFARPEREVFVTVRPRGGLPLWVSPVR